MSLYLLHPYEFYYILFVIFVIGACIGSFTNVVILRAFTGESIVLPPSKCPHCKNKLKWYHNIPIFSYLFLRGKCGFCKKKISIQYPIVELIVALLCVGTFLKYDFTLNSFILSIVAILCVIFAATDIKEQVIFDGHAYILAGIGLIYNFFDIGKSHLGTYDFSLFAHNLSINKSFIYSILGILAGAIIMEALAFAGKIFVGQRAFGEGDSYILSALGAVYRVQAVPQILLWAIVIQMIIIFPLFIKNLLAKKEYKIIWAISLFIFTVGLFKLFDSLQLLHNFYILLTAFLLMCICALYACKQLIQSAKNQNNLTFVPFGPPLVLASLFLMFI